MTTERVLRADARRNRARVLEEAESVLLSGGAGVPVEDIARAAGVGVGTVYRHFPTKQDLIDAIVAERMRRLVEQARSLSGGEDPMHALTEFVDAIVAESEVKKHLGVADPGPAGEKAAAIATVAADLHSVLAGHLANAQSDGLVRDDLDLTDLLSTLYGLTAAAEHYGWNAPRRRRAIGLTFDGLRPQPTGN